MAITLGAVVFDEAYTTATETYAEVGGRDARKVVLSGLILGEQSFDAIEARLDAILDAASAEDYGVALSLRAGRRLWVRRESFERAVRPDQLAGSFTLTLEAKDPFETAVSDTSVPWAVTASGATLLLTSRGNTFALPVITVIATGALINPSFSDGVRAIRYAGTIAAGAVLVFDGRESVVRLDGADVTPYSTGSFPEIAPEGATFTYTDDAASSHGASVTVAYRDRWW